MRVNKVRGGYTANSGGVSKTFKRKSEANAFLDKFRAAKTNTRAGTRSTTSKRKRSNMTKRSPRTGY